MELRQLAIFAAAAREKSYSTAARKLFISHSTVSRAVTALEAELGVRYLPLEELAAVIGPAAAETEDADTGVTGPAYTLSPAAAMAPSRSARASSA